MPQHLFVVRWSTSNIQPAVQIARLKCTTWQPWPPHTREVKVQFGLGTVSAANDVEGTARHAKADSMLIWGSRAGSLNQLT